MKKKIKYTNLILSILLSVIILIVGIMHSGTINFHYAVKKLIFPLSRLMAFITLGLAAGQIIESTGWTKQLSVIARPFFRFSNLGDRCSAAFTTAFVSGAAANAMLLDFYKDKKISKMQVFLTNFVNQLPAFFLHLPTTLFIVIPLTGFAGVLYFVLTFTATLLRVTCFLLFGHFSPSLKKNMQKSEIEELELKTDKNKKTIMEVIKEKLPRRVINVAIFVLPIYTLVFVLNADGFFTWLNHTLSHYLVISFMPVESLSVVILSFAAEFTSGFAAAGALMTAGVLSVKQTVLALLLGNITAFPIRALRHQLPRYMGIFSPKMGLQILLTGQFFRITSLILVGIIFYMVA